MATPLRPSGPGPLARDVPPDVARALETHRVALTGHCYRMLGSPAEADDAVQETLVRAWKSYAQFEGRAALRTWLFRIATRVCLDALGDRMKRTRSVDRGPVCTIDAPLTAQPAETWIEPIPDGHAIPDDVDPAQRAVLRQSIRLAFLAALQHLPPKQRAVLLLTEVLDRSAAETAETLDLTVAAVNSALQRARATLASRDVRSVRAPASEAQSALLARYVDAFERYDLPALTALLHQDAVMSMPPFDLWLRGHDAISAWFEGRGAVCKGSRLVPTVACGLPAFGQYHPGAPGQPHLPWALIVLEPVEDAGDGRLGAMTFFLDTKALFPRFGLPAELP